MRPAPRSSALLLALPLVALAACGSDPTAPATPAVTGSGAGGAGGAAGAGGTGGAAGAGGEVLPIPTCQGLEIPPGDVIVEPDGRTVALPCGAVDLRVSVLDPGTLRLRYLPAGAAPEPARPSYAVVDQPWPDPQARFGATEGAVLVCTDDILLEIDRATCLARAAHADGTVLLEDPPDGGYLDAGPGPGWRSLRRSAAPDERFYGFGEKTGPLDKRGLALTFWNTDAFQPAFQGYPPGADPLYQSIPFFIGLRGAHAYGVFLDNTHRLRFDMAAAEPGAYTLSAAAGEMDQYLFAGPAMADVVRRYTALTGRTPVPPRWSLGYHQSRWGYTPGDTVRAVAEELRARGIPADGIWLDIQHMDGFRSFTWDPVAFADPAALVQDLEALGFKATSIVDPGIKVDPAWDVYAAGLAGGHYLGTAGAPYVGEVWPGPAVFPDFSAPAARDWWSAQVPRTLDAGVRGLWIDMNEPSNFVPGAGGTVPDDLDAAGDGAPTTMAEVHNVYALNMARATHAGMRAAAPDRRPFLLTRAGYAGVQRYAAVWTGDAPSTWEILRETLPMLLGMGLSGVPFVGSDVGGYSGGPTPELFARWMQVGSFSPFFRSHVQTSAPPQEPWQFGVEVTDISREAISLRYELLPYLYSLFDEHARTGAPVLRPMVYEHQADPATHALGDQAMLGPYLLHAPALHEAASSRAVYFPAGRWFELRSGAVVEGPATVDVGLTLGALPIFVREGAILPRGPRMQWSDEAPLDPLTLDVYPADEPTSFTLYEDDGVSLAHESGQWSRVTYTLQRTATGTVLRAEPREGAFAPPPRRLLVRVRRIDHGLVAARLNGAPLAAHPSYEALLTAPQGAWYDARDLSAVVALPDQAPFELELDYDPSLSEPAPPVLMAFKVRVPPGTPTSTPVHLATSASGWTHQPLTWGPEPDTATGLVAVPRGQWLFYKYTRGGWDTVEKWPGCVEATNRYELGTAHPVKEDTVWEWADSCP